MMSKDRLLLCQRINSLLDKKNLTVKELVWMLKQEGWIFSSDETCHKLVNKFIKVMGQFEEAFSLMNYLLNQHGKPWVCYLNQLRGPNGK